MPTGILAVADHPTSYVVQRADEGNGSVNRGRDLRALIQCQRYLCRLPTDAEREALEKGFEALGVQITGACRRPPARSGALTAACYAQRSEGTQSQPLDWDLDRRAGQCRRVSADDHGELGLGLLLFLTSVRRPNCVPTVRYPVWRQ